jgi:hypothetical protein
MADVDSIHVRVRNGNGSLALGQEHERVGRHLLDASSQPAPIGHRDAHPRTDNKVLRLLSYERDGCQANNQQGNERGSDVRRSRSREDAHEFMFVFGWLRLRR